MQTDPGPIRKTGNKESHVINFRPSPNFLNMKRFLKKKIVDTAFIHETPGVFQPESTVVSSTPEKKETKPVIQPPLPLYPPPPDSPPTETLKVSIKKEIEDDYTVSTEDMGGLNLGQLYSNHQQTKPTTDYQTKKPRICKDFIRGNCLRKQCKYVHERDLSQLEGIYTFCWNYQNSTCMIPNCKYVHASPFEEGEFYRTGKLPEHALNHHKPTNPPKINILPPPPPPPPPKEPAPTYTMPPPMYRPVGMDLQVPLLAPPPPPMSDADRVLAEAFGMPHMQVTSSMKRKWGTTSTDDVPLTEDSRGPKTECDNCMESEFRLQYNTTKVEMALQSNKEISDKMVVLEKKMNKLYSVLMTIHNNPEQFKTPLVSPLICNDKQKSLMEQLSVFLQNAAEQSSSR